MTLEELHSINTPEIREIILKHRNDDPSEFALKNSGKNIPVRAIAEQIYCYQRAVKKLPLLSRQNLLYEKTALEQASGETTAKFKTAISGFRMMDLTGGLGIDSIYLSQKFDSLIYCESDPVLFEMFNINLNTLKLNNITTYNEDSITILQNYPDNFFDWLYVDPSRRTKGKRLLNAQNYSPNIIEHQDLLFSKAEKILIKLSPADEIEEIKKHVTNIDEIMVLSVDNECKEILVVLNRRKSKTHIPVEAVILNSKDDAFRIFSSKDNSPLITNPLKYFYEPDAAIIKAKITAEVAAQYSLKFINNSVDYLTSENHIPDFPGRKFIIKEYFTYNKKHLAGYFKTLNIKNANFARRDFPDSPEVLRTKYKIEDGGNDYFFFTRDKENKLIVVHCTKPEHSL